MPLVNYNSQKELIVSKQLKNGERFKMKFEAGTGKEFAKREFMRAYEIKNSLVK